ncbi:MAG: hypothetical protein RDO_1550 [Flavobacteriales endosymbiont of Rhyzopertha dominica]|nr:MAG: GTPase HflX [Candidatus Shikimatogenerans bostrichidophilus]
MYKNNILIGIFKNNINKINNLYYLNELKNLLKVFKGKVINKFLQKRIKPHRLTYVGKGFLKNISEYILNNKNIDTVIFDDELSLSQIKNIEKYIKCNISDRTKLILDIFYYKAKTFNAKLQIKLAQYEYLLPRLKHMWKHLERQKGGIGMRGPGEKEIETDKRRIKNSILKIKKKLKKINNNIIIKRNNRRNKISISVIGYTNVGKSTIINDFIKKKLLVENKYFTTLDTNVNYYYYNNNKFIIIDTIGFIRKIPTTLIESFKSTLLEIKKSDIIIHIIDISSINIVDKYLYIMNFLIKLKIINKKIITIINKIDKIKNNNIKKYIISNIYKNKILKIKNNKIYYIYKINNNYYKKISRFYLYSKKIIYKNKIIDSIKKYIYNKTKNIKYFTFY